MEHERFISSPQSGGKKTKRRGRHSGHPSHASLSSFLVFGNHFQTDNGEITETGTGTGQGQGQDRDKDRNRLRYRHRGRHRSS